MGPVLSWRRPRQKHGLTSFMQFLIQSLMKDRIWLQRVLTPFIGSLWLWQTICFGRVS